MTPLVLWRLLLWLGAVCAAAAAPLLRSRAVIPHDAVVGFPETVPTGPAGQAYLRHKPYLRVYGGCVPFPAVNAAGDTGGGLAPTGASNGGCSSSRGQVYARQGTHAGRRAIMYAYYMPKDSPSSGLGHRHDWESAVVWLSGSDYGSPVLGVAASAHGDFDARLAADVAFSGGGTRPRLGYRSFWPLNHQMVFTDDQGGEQPLVAWESLTAEARRALEGTDFGAANVPLNDANFGRNLARAAV